MEKKTLILHIGQSKTGTSSIQKFCQTHRQDLAKEGILYPILKKNGIPINLLEHNAFAESLCGVDRYPNVPYHEAIRQFDAQFKMFSGNKMLLSAESFWGIPHIWTLNSADEFLPAYRSKLEKLHEWVKNYHLHVVLYLRHPLDWFRSAVSHIIRHEGLLGKRIYKSDDQLYDFLCPHMDYLSLLQLWRDVLQPETMDIKVFDRKSLLGGDAVTDFFTGIGYVGQLSKMKEENTSWPAEFTIVKRELNARGYSKWQELALIGAINKISSQCSGGPPYQISTLLQQRILDDVMNQTGGLEKEFNISFPVAEIFPPKEIENDLLESIKNEIESTVTSFRFRLKVASFQVRWLLRKYMNGPYNFIKRMIDKGGRTPVWR